MDEDDYWNTSETKAAALSFDDDVLTTQEMLAIGQNSIPGQSEENFLNKIVVAKAKTMGVPLGSLVSPQVLELILLAQSGSSMDPRPECEETVSITLKRLVLGRRCTLRCHRSLKSKTELLDGALAIGDGNAVLTVILFLVQTLNKKIAYQQLAERPVALSHYLAFLQHEGKHGELTDLLTMLGRSPDAAMHQYKRVMAQGVGLDCLLLNLNELRTKHFEQPCIDQHQAKMLAEHMKQLEWLQQVNKEVLNTKSVIQCLAYCCANHYNEGAGNSLSPLTLCQRHQISPLQYDWVLMNVLAKCGRWDTVESLLTKKDWLGRATMMSHIPVEILVARLSELQAAPRLLAACLHTVPGHAERLRLAHMFKVHSVVIETLAKEKDRIGLTNYKMTLNPQSEEYILAENTLRATSIKWKN